MKEMGIKGKLLSWLKVFLCNRTHQVRIENTLSDPRAVTSGVPQGSVLGPLLFLIFIQDLGIDMENAMIHILKFVDDTKVMGDIKNEDDILMLQNNLDKIYSWACDNNMRWNNGKFQILRIGSNKELIEDTLLFSPDYENVIESKSFIKDLGILVDTDVRYCEQMDAAVRKSNKKISWIFRTFSTRNIDFLKKIWKSLVQCHLDYGSTLWSPVSRKLELRALEGPLRAYTKRGSEMYKYNYWDRLKFFKLSSVQRRNDRYRILYIWKSLNGMVPSLGLKWKKINYLRAGPQLEIKKPKGSLGVQHLQRDSISNYGARLFNNLPASLRTFSGTLITFKTNLDKLLQHYPDFFNVLFYTFSVSLYLNTICASTSNTTCECSWCLQCVWKCTLCSLNRALHPWI